MRVRAYDKSNVALFLIGLFSMTQINIVGWLGISEVFCFVAGPFFFLMDQNALRRNGFMPFVGLISLCFISGIISNFVNYIPPFQALKGLSTIYAIFSISVTLHHYLYRDLKGVRWLFVGIAISTTACQFVFQQGNTRVAGGEVLDTAAAAERAMGYSLFWLVQSSNWLGLPVRAWYLNVPTIYSAGVMLFLGILGFVHSNSRSSMITLVPVVLILLGRKKIKTMKFLHKNFWLCVGASVLFLPIAGATYKYTARQGMLGESAQKKYESQTKRGTDMMSILVSGRSEFFAGLFAVLEKPIVGHGSWAIDYKGYYESFLKRYGDADDWRVYYEQQSQGKLRIIPAHSQLISFWLWNGIGGLAFMLYVGWLYFDCLKNRLHVIPEWYGYFVSALPTALWAWLFSPFGMRVSASLLFVMCLFARAVSKGWYRSYRPPFKTLR